VKSNLSVLASWMGYNMKKLSLYIIETLGYIMITETMDTTLSFVTSFLSTFSSISTHASIYFTHLVSYNMRYMMDCLIGI